MTDTTLNASESAIASQPPVAGQSPVSAALVSGLRSMFGGTDVPNSLVPGLLGAEKGSGGVLSGIAGATPWGAAANVLGGMLSSPDPSLTTSAESGADARFGANYVRNMAGQSKAGAFNVTSGDGSANSQADTNAENRERGASGVSFGAIPGWVWVAVALGGVVFLIRKRG